ncbi:MAG: hypothetical protein QXX75_01925 [Thermoplasmatales archaeon]
MRILGFLLVLIALSSLLIPTSFGNTSQGPVTVVGPSSVAVNSSFNYTVYVQDIFSNYSVSMILSGYNLTGASPVSPTYDKDLTSGPAVFNIKAPTVPTTLFLYFQVVGNLRGQKYYYNLSSVVKVNTVTILSASIRNPTDFNITGVNVTFAVNGKYVGSTIVNISRNSTENVTYQWVSGNLPSGIYTVTVSLNSTLLKLQNGGSYSFKIQAGNPFISYIYIGIAAFLIIIVTVALISGYYARKRKPKWKK